MVRPAVRLPRGGFGPRLEQAREPRRRGGRLALLHGVDRGRHAVPGGSCRLGCRAGQRISRIGPRRVSGWGPVTGPLAAVALLTDGLGRLPDGIKAPALRLGAGVLGRKRSGLLLPGRLRAPAERGGRHAALGFGRCGLRRAALMFHTEARTSPPTPTTAGPSVCTTPQGSPGHGPRSRASAQGSIRRDWDAEWIRRRPGGRAPLEVLDGALRVAGSPYLPLPCPPVRQVRLEARLRPAMGWAGPAPAHHRPRHRPVAGTEYRRNRGPPTCRPVGHPLRGGAADRDPGQRPAGTQRACLPGTAARQGPGPRNLAGPQGHGRRGHHHGHARRRGALYRRTSPPRPDSVEAWPSTRVRAARLTTPRSSSPTPLRRVASARAAPADGTALRRTPSPVATASSTTGSTPATDHAHACLARWDRTTAHRQPDEWTLARTDLTLSGKVVRARLFAAASHQALFSIDGEACLETSSFGYPGEGYYDAADVTALLQANPDGNGPRLWSSRPRCTGTGRARAGRPAFPGSWPSSTSTTTTAAARSSAPGPAGRWPKAPYRQSGYRNDEGDPVEHLDGQPQPGPSAATGPAGWEQATSLGRHPVADFPAVLPRRTFLARTPVPPAGC